MLEGLTTRQLKFAQWYLEHKNLFYKLFVGFLILIILIFFSVAIYNITLYITMDEIQQATLRELTIDRINFVLMHKILGPEDLVIDKQFLIYNKNSGYDFIAIVENSNLKWRILLVEYYFLWADGRTELKKTFIMPQSKKYIFALNQEIQNEPRDIELVFSKIKWKRVRPEKQWILSILPKLKISNIKIDYIVPEQKMISLPKISFNIKNQSLYDFRQIDFIITLYKGKQMVGFNKVSIKKLFANEKREVELMWTRIPQSTEIQVILDVDIFSPDVFMSNI